MTSEPLISLEHLDIGYDQLPVLWDVNLRLDPGTFIGLLGANGSGKSTLIKTILGIIPPLSGAADGSGIDRGDPSSWARPGIALRRRVRGDCSAHAAGASAKAGGVRGVALL